jgi:aspartyl/asparaginyl beta-hydroxylase (cupin superfamily)
MAQSADRAAREGRWADAERLWEEVRRLEPRHPRALFSLGMHAMQRGDLKTAKSLLGDARAVSPRELPVLHSLGIVLGRLGEREAELEAIEASLAVDAYFLPGMLAKGGWLERSGARAEAATLYRNCLKVAPPETHWPEPLRPQLGHARAFAGAYAEELHSFLQQELSPVEGSLSTAEQERWREAASIMAGRTRPYSHDANQLYAPRLPAIPFYDRSMFPWASELEAKTGVIRDELKAALEKEGKEFTPYIAYRPGDPVNQWKELNHSTRWSHYSLWRGGGPEAAHLAQCPETRKALEAVDMAAIEGLCPNAMFSALAPHTEIPPHHGETNARLVVHLPLIVPEKCTYRVGFEHRTWKVGEILVFDDTLEHTARNDSDDLRVVLILDIWNPLLSSAERQAVRKLAAAARKFTAVQGASPG